MAAYGVQLSDAQAVLEMAFGGKTATQKYEDEKKFDVRIRYNQEYRKNEEDISNLKVPTIAGSKIPMKYNPQGLIETTKQNKNTKSNILNSEPKKRENLGTTHTNYPKSIHTFSRVSGNHPTEKPLELLEYLVKTYTNEGDMVLDNTMGSGTTNLACIKLNRKSIGIEKEKQYYDVAVRRASEYCH